jgi:periplasmic protein TonB
MRATLCGALMSLTASTASAQPVQSQDRALKPEAAKQALLEWRSQVISILERFKYYPASARSNREHGKAYLSFTINREGRITSARIDRSSGSAALDAETLALAYRASFPPPPAEIVGRRLQVLSNYRP